MMICMVANQVALFLHPLYNLRVFLHIGARHKKGRFHAPLRQSVKQLFRIAGMRAVVKRNGDTSRHIPSRRVAPSRCVSGGFRLHALCKIPETILLCRTRSQNSLRI